MRTGILAVLSTLAALTATAHADKPSWCGDGKRVLSSKMDPETLTANPPVTATSVDLMRTGLSVCANPKNSKLAKVAAKVRASYMLKHGTSDAEVDQILAAAAAAKISPDDELHEGCQKANARLKRGVSYQQRVEALPLAAIGCWTDALFGQHGGAWLADFPDQPPTQFALAYNLLDQIDRDPTVVAAYPRSALDAAALDRAAFDKELAQLKLPPTLRARALDLFFTAGHVTAMEKAKLEAASDPQSKALLAIPDRAKAEWAKLYADHKDAMDLAFAMERKVMDLPDFGQDHAIGCADLRKNYRAYVASKKPKTVAEAEALSQDAVGFVLLQGVALCDGAENHMVEAQLEKGVLTHRNGREFHGPRYYAMKLAADQAIAMENAGQHPALPANAFSTESSPGIVQLVAASNADSVHMNPMYDDPSTAQGNASQRATKRGHVKSVTKSGDRLLVTFKVEKWQAPDQTCTKGKLVNWDHSGPIFDYDCKVTGYHEESSTLQDMTMLPDIAGDLKVGQLVQVVASMAVSGKPSVGAVFMTGEPKGKDIKWTSLLGVPVK